MDIVSLIIGIVIGLGITLALKLLLWDRPSENKVIDTRKKKMRTVDFSKYRYNQGEVA